MFLRSRKTVVPSFSAVFRSEVEEKGEERTIVFAHSLAPSPVVVPDKESPHVQNNKRKPGCCHACCHPLRGCTIMNRLIDKQATKMQPVHFMLCEAVVIWFGAGRCRRTIADVDEPSKKCRLFIFGVGVYASFPTTRTETQRTGVLVRLKEQQSNLFPIMVRQDPRKSQNSLDKS